jgi:GMP synthase (glutamine-hydrolysing)
MSTESDKPMQNHTGRVATSGDIEVTTYLEIAKEKSGIQPSPTTPTIPAADREVIIVLDFGSQYSLLIARRIRECNVYSELLPFDTPWEKIADLNPKGIIMSGGPSSVYEPGAPLAPSYIYEAPARRSCYLFH